MNKIFSIIRSNILVVFALSCLGLGVTTSCSDDSSAPANFYSAIRMTAAEVVKNNEDYSKFRRVLERADYLSMLSTYGQYTVFVPNNAAMDTFLVQNGYTSMNVDSLPLAVCDTLSRMHIVKHNAFFTTDMSSKSAPMNMNDVYVEMSAKAGADEVEGNTNVDILVNKYSRIIAQDDSVTNGVVHIVDRVLKASNSWLPDFMAEDSTISIFCEALVATRMCDSLTKYIDETYPEINRDSTEDSKDGFIVPYGSNGDGSPKPQNTYYPEKRFFKYSAFVETNAVYAKYNIHTLDDLKEYAKQIYDESYPEDAGKYDKDPTDRRNPLNRFVSYHLINRMGLYTDWVISFSQTMAASFIPGVADPEDYFETMLPHSIMRFSDSGGQLYINRKGLKGNVYEGCPGVRVLKSTEYDRDTKATNGNYFYIDDMLTYDYKTRNVALNRRMRIDASCLSPDFMNSGTGARAHHIDDPVHPNFMMGFKKGFLADWKISDETFVGCRKEDPTWRHYEGNGVCVNGKYDVSIKLPGVPFSGTWEIRMGYSKGNDRGAAQVYLNNEPCGIPVDFTYNDNSDGWTEDIEGDDEYNKAIDKAMRNRGFMKAMDSYGGSSSFRTLNTNYRRILTKQFMSSNEEYWLRFRQVVDDPNLYMSLDYIELVPKSVYDSPQGEDRH
ncbi:MAG: fasciclin domain-containing protein [Prevotella sp.]|nr:fasciclin domain-containing protein [Candidatus Prevotella equi]